mmetsp:Transcript_16546/g.38026  ORF Transcript_16546/g.38026 Transcript_16546/m.38026 type:complete len:612 (-) Transcript_16546:78-1913(-)
MPYCGPMRIVKSTSFSSSSSRLASSAFGRQASTCTAPTGQRIPKIANGNLGTQFRRPRVGILQAKFRPIIANTRNVPQFTRRHRFSTLLGCRQTKQPSHRQITKRGMDGGRRSKSDSSKTAAEATTEAEPCFDTLRWMAFTTGLPFIGFGFMDNFILIIAGDMIDTSLGVTLGISTMCAAAIGNIISDLAGIGCAAYIEDFCATTLKMPIPTLSAAQRQLRSVRFASQGGMAIGMTIGCILGMIPLMFIDSKKADTLKKKAQLERLCLDVLNEAKSLVGAEVTSLYLRVDKNEEGEASEKRNGLSYGLLPDYHPSVNGEYLYAMYYVEPPNRNHGASVGTSTTNVLLRMVSSGSRGTPDRGTNIDSTKLKIAKSSDNEKEDADVDLVAPESPSSSSKPHPVSTSRVLPVGKGIVSRAVLTGTTWNISGNLMEEPDFYPLSIEAGTYDDDCTDHDHFRDCAVVPILDRQGRVIAVLEAFNKDSGNTGGFTDQDVQILISLASHVSVGLRRIYQDREEEEEEGMGLKDTIQILNEGRGVGRSGMRPNLTGTSDENVNGSEDAAIATTQSYARGSESREQATRGSANMGTGNHNTTTTSPLTVTKRKAKLFPDN